LKRVNKDDDKNIEIVNSIIPYLAFYYLEPNKKDEGVKQFDCATSPGCAI